MIIIKLNIVALFERRCPTKKYLFFSLSLSLVHPSISLVFVEETHKRKKEVCRIG
jgi:hypothetical protein